MSNSIQQHQDSNAQIGVGQLCTDKAQRDAIHIAVYPLMAGMRLSPNDGVKIVDGMAMFSDKKMMNYIGNVDPYLTKDVLPGQRFYVFLKPMSISGLRHHWSHDVIDTMEKIEKEKDALLRGIAFQEEDYETHQYEDDGCRNCD